MLNQIRGILEKTPRVAAWRIMEIESQGHQLYTTFKDIEAVRATRGTGYRVQIITRNENGGAEPVQGTANFEINPGEHNLTGKINQAVEQAALQKNTPYDLPGNGWTYPDFNDADPVIRDTPEKYLDQLQIQLQDLAAEYPSISLPGSEFFLKHQRTRLVNSHGIDVSSEGSSLMWDVVLFHREGNRDSEFWTIFQKTGGQYFNLEQDFRKFVTYAMDAARTEIPRSGSCPVILTGDALHILFQYFLYHSSGMAAYNHSALFKPGESVLPEAAVGDTMTLFSNPLHPGGTQSFRFDPDGLPGKRVEVIKDGILTQYWANNQYSRYLGIPATGEFGNLEISPGTTPWDELLKSHDRVVLVLQFSTFDPQPVAGNYMGEIRVGYEYRADGSVIPLRGGSVSGNVVTSMLNCRFAKEMETFDSYFGPRGVRFETAQVAGK